MFIEWNQVWISLGVHCRSLHRGQPQQPGWPRNAGRRHWALIGWVGCPSKAISIPPSFVRYLWHSVCLAFRAPTPTDRACVAKPSPGRRLHGSSLLQEWVPHQVKAVSKEPYIFKSINFLTFAPSSIEWSSFTRVGSALFFCCTSVIGSWKDFNGRERVRDACAESSWPMFDELLNSTTRGNYGNLGRWCLCMFLSVGSFFCTLRRNVLWPSWDCTWWSAGRF